MLKISDSQWESMETEQENSFLRQLAPELVEEYPEPLEHLSEPALNNVLAIWAENAQKLGFDTQRDVRYFARISLELGHQFYQDEQLPWVKKCLANNLSGWGKMSRLQARAIYHVEYMLGVDQHLPRDPYQRFRASWKESIQRPMTISDIGRLFHDIWPRKAETLSSETIMALHQRTPVLQYTDKAERVILAFLLGSGFETDPLYPWYDNPDFGSEPLWSHLDSIYLEYQ